jgi:hypothetical protein
MKSVIGKNKRKIGNNLVRQLFVNPAPQRSTKRLSNTVWTESINSKVESFATTASGQPHLCSSFPSPLVYSLCLILSNLNVGKLLNKMKQ